MSINDYPIIFFKVAETPLEKKIVRQYWDDVRKKTDSIALENEIVSEINFISKNKKGVVKNTTTEDTVAKKRTCLFLNS